MNKGIELNYDLIESDPNFSDLLIIEASKIYSDISHLTSSEKLLYLLMSIRMIDLTTLAGDDSFSNVRRLCYKSQNPLSPSIKTPLSAKFSQSNIDSITTGAVCVYPSMLKHAKHYFDGIEDRPKPNLAAVATGFPSGLYHLPSRLEEIRNAIADGANEIDIVIDRSLALQNKWHDIYREVSEMKALCSSLSPPGSHVHLKAILAVGELGSYTRVYRCSLVCLMAGADFIKTSTGKESVNATIPVGYVMCLALQRYRQITGIEAGLKPAGGIKTSDDALHWMMLVGRMMGPHYLTPRLFRIGASSLLADVERTLFRILHGVSPGDRDILCI